MPFPKVKSHELASCFNCEADLAGNQWFESSYPTEPRDKQRVASTALLTLPDDDFTKP